MKVKFKLVGQTKGAIRYEEVDEAGRALVGDASHITTMYFRKATFASVSPEWASLGVPPQFITVEVAA